MQVLKAEEYERFCRANGLPVAKKREAVSCRGSSSFSDEEIEEHMKEEQDRNYAKLGVHLTYRDKKDKSYATTTGGAITVRHMRGLQ